MSANNIVGGKNQIRILKPETIIKSKDHDIRADNMENMDSLDMNIFAIK